MRDEITLYHQKLEQDEKYINSCSPNKPRRFVNDYGEVMEEDDRVLLNNCNVPIKYEDIDRTQDISESAKRMGEGTLICPCCGREIGEFESHDIHFVHGEAIGCDMSPQGKASFFEHYLKETD